MKTRTPPPHDAGPASRFIDPQTLDDLLLYNLSRLHARAVGVVTRYCEGEFGITHREWRILAILADRGCLGSSALAEHAQLDRPRTSRAINSLDRKGLLVRQTPKGDARQVDVMLTPKGEALYREVFPLVRRINLQLLGALEPQEVSLLEGFLGRLNASVESFADDADIPMADRRHGGSRRQRPEVARRKRGA